MSLNESIVKDDAPTSFGELGYPPDTQKEATRTVLAQAELLCAGFVA